MLNVYLNLGLLRTVKECGMPFFDNPVNYGNLYLSFNFKLPNDLDQGQAEKLLR